MQEYPRSPRPIYGIKRSKNLCLQGQKVCSRWTRFTIVNSITGSQVSLSEQPLQHDPSLNNLSTAVASMRRTEALTSVKFYQILSIFIFFIRPIILEDFIRLISYNGPCVRLGCSFFLATALLSVMYQSVLNIGYFKYLLNIRFVFFLFPLYILYILMKVWWTVTVNRWFVSSSLQVLHYKYGPKIN